MLSWTQWIWWYYRGVSFRVKAPTSNSALAARSCFVCERVDWQNAIEKKTLMCAKWWNHRNSCNRNQPRLHVPRGAVWPDSVRFPDARVPQRCEFKLSVMITNNTTYKLKAGQGSKTSPSSTADGDGDESPDTDNNHKFLYVPGVHPKVRVAKQSPANFYISKGATSRNDRDRRNNFNRRGGQDKHFPRDRDLRGGKDRNERERDYFDSLSLFQYGKYATPSANLADADKKAEKEIKFNLPEDTRISKLLRRLSIEEDPENSLQISRKLLEVLMLPENATYVRKSFAILRDSMLHILQVAPGPQAKKQCARAFGRP